jgi:hypothetical protein
LEPLLEQAEPADSEIGGGHIERPSLMFVKQPIQHVGEAVVLIVNDVWDSHSLSFFQIWQKFFSNMAKIWQKYGKLFWTIFE